MKNKEDKQIENIKIIKQLHGEWRVKTRCDTMITYHSYWKLTWTYRKNKVIFDCLNIILPLKLNNNKEKGKIKWCYYG